MSANIEEFVCVSMGGLFSGVPPIGPVTDYFRPIFGLTPSLDSLVYRSLREPMVIGLRPIFAPTGTIARSASRSPPVSQSLTWKGPLWSLYYERSLEQRGHCSIGLVTDYWVTD